jgi:hypothetical protein
MVQFSETTTAAPIAAASYETIEMLMSPSLSSYIATSTFFRVFFQYLACSSVAHTSCSMLKEWLTDILVSCFLECTIRDSGSLLTAIRLLLGGGN